MSHRRTGLLANRSFTLLWGGNTLGDIGSQAQTLAMPLLVLALTHSPAKAGLVTFARAVAFPLCTLPAGVLADRYSRRALMAVSGAVRAVAMVSVVLALAVGRPPLLQLVLVAFLSAVFESVATVAERGLLTAVVTADELPDAIAANEARYAVSVVGGPPLGGLLFGIARGLPFVADAASVAIGSLALLGVRPRSEQQRAESVPTLRSIREGFMWLWRLPFLRTGSLLYAGANVTFTAAQLLVVLIARRHGASSASIGLAFAVVGAAGLVGATLAGPLRRRLSPRWAILTEAWIAVLCFPLLLVAHSPLSIGLVLGATVLPMAVSTSVLVSHRLTLAPDYLRGRVQASGAFIAMSVAWIGPLVIGVLFQAAGESIAVLVITGWALLVATGGTLAPGLRHLPTPDEAAAAAVAAARSAS